MQNGRKLIIIGSGPAGLTAAIYAGRANLQPLVIEGNEFGGQLMLTTDVENYPGFPEGILGPELMALFKKQAERFGAEFLSGAVTAVDFSRQPFKIWVGDRELTSQAVIVATGASANWLGLESEQRLIGRGVSACAPCDAPLFKGKEVVVVGGGDSAMEEALTLTKFASKVSIIHRRLQLRASKIMQERVRNHPQINLILNTVVEEILGEDRVRGVKLRDVATGKVFEMDCQGVFVAIGHTPNTQVFAGQLDLDEKGYIRVTEHTRTSVQGVFTAGDVHDHYYRQAITAAAFGCMAAIDAEKWLDSQN